MQLQVKTAGYWVTFAFSGVLFLSNAHAGCFDFSKVTTEPLHPLTVSAKNESGMREGGITWASVRGDVNNSVDEIVKDLVEHRSTKSSRVSEMKLKELTDLKDPRNILKQEAKMEVDPFPFVSVKWTEVWAFAATKGTKEKPDRVVVSYEKTEGTSHIEHLCGSYVLQRLPNNKTDVFIYEEAKATNRSVQDTLHGLEGNLKALNRP